MAAGLYTQIEPNKDLHTSNSTLNLLPTGTTSKYSFWDNEPNLMHRNENDGDSENEIYGKRMPK